MFLRTTENDRWAMHQRMKEGFYRSCARGFRLVDFESCRLILIAHCIWRILFSPVDPGLFANPFRVEILHLSCTSWYYALIPTAIAGVAIQLKNCSCSFQRVISRNEFNSELLLIVVAAIRLTLPKLGVADTAK